MKYRHLSIAAVSFLLGAFVLVSIGISSAATKEAPLTNQDVVKLSKLGLGDQVIIEKINQAEEVNFSLDVDGLTSLKKDGVSQSVIAAMIRKSSAKERAEKLRASVVREESVELVMPNGSLKLQGAYNFKSDVHYSRSLLFSNALSLKGAKAHQSISQSRPTILITTVAPMEDTESFFLVKFNEGSDERLYRMGSIRQIGSTSITGSAPHEKMRVPYSAERQSPLVWRLIPKEALKPGEYAVMVYDFEIGDWKIFDFGVQ